MPKRRPPRLRVRPVPQAESPLLSDSPPPREKKRDLAPAEPHRPPYAASALAGLLVLALYALTLAPTTAFWDAGEYISVAHILGIPHPPGSPLFVLLGRAWDLLLSPTGLPVAVRLNLFSATLSALSHALWFLVLERSLVGWTGDRRVRLLTASLGVLLSATAFTVWNQSTVNEKVYSISFLTTAWMSWTALRWRDTGRQMAPLLLLALLLGLTITNHLMGALAAPALLLFVLRVEPHSLLRPRLWALGIPLFALALSVQLFLPLRAAERPIISEGDPQCESITGSLASIYSNGRTGCPALSAMLSREQYGKPSIFLDPTLYPQEEVPRSAGLLAAQLANYLQYFDWQWARSVAGNHPLFGGARPLFTALFLVLGIWGIRGHWRSDREGALYLTALFLTLSLGLVLYLNFRYGYSMARDRFPESFMHEVRERDYFFPLSFSLWGLWAGVGLASLWRRAALGLALVVRRPQLLATPVLLLALLPLLLNWRWAGRADDYFARDWAYNVLMSVEPYGVIVTNGDNDSFPLWYLQMVEGVRPDITIVLAPYLNTPWFIKQIRDLTRPCPAGVDPMADPTRILCQRPFRATDLPPALQKAGWAQGVQPPRGSIIPLSDREIERMAQEYFVAPRDLAFQAGSIETTIRQGTPLLPADSFAAAMLKATLGQRPVYFMPGADIVETLGLAGYTVRQGLVWEILGAPLAQDERGRIVPLPESELSPVAGAAIDLATTDRLVREVYLRRGRVLDEQAPWVDAAVSNIPAQYAYAHYAAAQGHSVLGHQEAMEWYIQRAEWWLRVSE